MKLQIDLVSTPSTIEQRSVHKKKKKMKRTKELSTSINEPRQALLPVISSTKLTHRALQKALFLGYPPLSFLY